MSEVVDLFFRGRPVEQQPKLHHDMERAVEMLQGAFPENMAAFVMLAVDEDGYWSVKFSIREGLMLGRRMLAGLATEAIREHLVTEACVDARLEGS